MVERITEAMVEAGARGICLSQGRDPDEMAPRSLICGPKNERLPFWHYYAEQAGACLVAALATEPGEAEGWQPIESAPHIEQQEFMVCNAIGERAIAVWWPLRGGWDVGIYYDDNPDAETALAQSWIYWRHLPAAPTSEGSHHG